MRNLIITFSLALLMISCDKKEMNLTRSAYTVEETVEDISPIYIEYGEDGVSAHLNDNNRIGGTNFIFHIERELSLKQVAELVKKVKDNKYEEGKMHTDDKGIYYSYADTLSKHLAFYPFQNIDFLFERPSTTDNLFYVNASNDYFFEGNMLPKKDLLKMVESRDSLQLAFSKELNFERYLQMRILLEELEISDKFVPIDRIY